MFSWHLIFPVCHPQIKILQATGLPQYLSNFVFCQYSFWDQPEPIIVAPEVDTSSSSPSNKDPHCMVVFDSCKVNMGGKTRISSLATNQEAFLSGVYFDFWLCENVLWIGLNGTCFLGAYVGASCVRN